MNRIKQEYYNMKAKHPDAVLLWRHGDSYWCYEEDARKVATSTGITLVERDGLTYASFPHTKLDTFNPKLIRSGFRIAIFEFPPMISEPESKE